MICNINKDFYWANGCPCRHLIYVQWYFSLMLIFCGAINQDVRLSPTRRRSILRSISGKCFLSCHLSEAFCQLFQTKSPPTSDGWENNKLYCLINLSNESATELRTKRRHDKSEIFSSKIFKRTFVTL